MKEMRVGYNVGCTMGLLLGQSAWQIERPSNGSMWNSYSFQLVGPWMGYMFADLGAEGCCRSLNALFIYTEIQVLQFCVLVQPHGHWGSSHKEWPSPSTTWRSVFSRSGKIYLNSVVLTIDFLDTSDSIHYTLKFRHFDFTARRG